MSPDLRVAALIVEDGKVLTTKMEREGEKYHVLPGGGVEEAETVEEALRRELKEETGLKIADFRLSYLRELSMDHGRGVEFYFWVDRYEGDPGTGYDPEDKDAELVETGFIDLKELGEASFHPEQLVDVLTGSDLPPERVEHLGLQEYDPS